ncbi:MAG: hypothetical protein ACRDUW_19870, partial [Pseudonocardiaceae bacterium]
VQRRASVRVDPGIEQAEPESTPSRLSTPSPEPSPLYDDEVITTKGGSPPVRAHPGWRSTEPSVDDLVDEELLPVLGDADINRRPSTDYGQPGFRS